MPPFRRLNDNAAGAPSSVPRRRTLDTSRAAQNTDNNCLPSEAEGRGPPPRCCGPSRTTCSGDACQCSHGSDTKSSKGTGTFSFINCTYFFIFLIKIHSVLHVYLTLSKDIKTHRNTNSTSEETQKSQGTGNPKRKVPTM